MRLALRMVPALPLLAALAVGPAGAQTAPAQQGGQPPLSAQQERMRTCQAEATAKNLNGEPRQRFVNACLAGNTAAGGTTAAAGAAGSGNGRFLSETQAKRACGGEAVVWANPDSQVFHLAGSQFYGKTQQGAYMCRPAAEKAGFRSAGGGRN